MTTATYKCEVDWDGDLSWDHINSDITAYVRSATYKRGKDSELGKASTGTLELVLNNDSQIFSPEYSAGALHDLLLPKRAIRLTTTAPAAYNLFYGYIEQFIPHPAISEQSCYVYALDGFDYLSRAITKSVLYKSHVTGELITHILNDAGWSAALRSIDTGQDIVPYFYSNDQSCLNALRDIENSELGFIIINGAGQLCWEDRQHRWKTPHHATQATFSDSMVAITYDYSAKQIYNRIEAVITPWELQPLAEIWRLETEEILAAGASVIYYPEFLDFADAITTPVATTDYLAYTGTGATGTDKTTSLTVAIDKFAQGAKLTITNGWTASLYLYLFRLRGTLYNSRTKITKYAEDTASQTAYQKRVYRLDGKYLTNASTAQEFCNWAVGRYKDPGAEISVTIVNEDTARLTQILSREISDRVTIVNTELGLSDDFYIDYMTHTITDSGTNHKVVYKLSKSANEEAWILGTSKLGIGTRLGL